MNPERDRLIMECAKQTLELARIADTLRCTLDFVIENAHKFSPDWKQRIETVVERQVVLLTSLRQLDLKELCSNKVINLNEYKNLRLPFTLRNRQ